MSSEDPGFEGRFIEEYLRYLRGRGPRPQTAHLPEKDRDSVEDLFEVLEAIVDREAISLPSFEEDPVAIRLGLAAEQRVDAGVSQVTWLEGLSALPEAIAASLTDVAQQLEGEIEMVRAARSDVVTLGANTVRVEAECRSLGELIVICSTSGDDLSSLPGALTYLFAARPAATAVAVVSSVSGDAAVLTHADCVRAIDPIAGWVEPGLPSPPEPLELALRRHLEKSLPRWDAVAPLDELLLLAQADEDVDAAAGEAMRDNLGRTARIPAKKRALASLADLDGELLISVLQDVRAGRLAGENLVGRLREIAGPAPS